jgi:hypothetical protein
VGGGIGGSMRAFATGGGGAWMGVGEGVGVGNCVGETGLAGDGDAVGVWMVCERFCVVDDVVI